MNGTPADQRDRERPPGHPAPGYDVPRGAPRWTRQRMDVT